MVYIELEFALLKKLGLKPFSFKKFCESGLLFLLPIITILEVATYILGESIFSFSLKMYLQGATLMFSLFYLYWLRQLREEK